MTTITQRKKGWWKIWVIIGLIAAVIAIVAVLAMFEIIDVQPWIEGYLGAFMWASESVINALILTVGFVVTGVLFCYLWYNYLRGQKTTTNTPAGTGYAPVPTYPSQPAQSGQETTIS